MSKTSLDLRRATSPICAVRTLRLMAHCGLPSTRPRAPSSGCSGGLVGAADGSVEPGVEAPLVGIP